MINFEQCYLDLIRCSGSCYLVVFLLLLCYKTPKSEVYRPYRTSKNLLAFAFLNMSLTDFLWLAMFSGDWNHPGYVVMAIDIILFFLTSVLVSHVFCNLIEKDYINRRHIMRDASLWLLASVCALAAQPESMAPYRTLLFGISLLLLVSFFVYFIYYFQRLLRKKKKTYYDYFAYDVMRFSTWMNTSILFAIISGLFAIVTIFTGIVVNWLYQFYVMCFNMYIAINFINFVEKFGEMGVADSEIDSVRTDNNDKVPASEGYMTQLQPKVDEWIKSRKYVEEQFTIDEIASTLATNKYYLSRYINQKYGMNFSLWVTTLRIGEAKRMITESPLLKMETIATRSGFSSASYFSKAFSRVEGISPAQWRKENT